MDRGAVARLLFASAVLTTVPLRETRAQDQLQVTGVLDLRAVRASSDTSWLNGGYGSLRYDSGHDGFEVGRAQFIARLRLGDLVTLHAVGGTYGDHDRNPLDLSELWLEARPYPSGPLRWRLKLGAFHAPISLEHRAAGWNTVYTITPSALNSWLGEEFRTIGAEVEARWLGASSGYRGDVAFTGAVFGWNDPAGAILADRGFALSDRPSTLFGGLGRPSIELYHEIDHRPGFYNGIAWRHHDRLEFRAQRYDNRADPGAATSAGYAWRTWFTSLGARYEPDARWTFIVQHLAGATFVGPNSDPVNQFELTYRADFVLVSAHVGRERFSARFDDFRTRQQRLVGAYPSDDSGHAWTIAWLHDFDEHWSAAVEYLHVRSSFPPRAPQHFAVDAPATQVQLALRYRVDAGF
jgi:hypothetical protein